MVKMRKKHQSKNVSAPSFFLRKSPRPCPIFQIEWGEAPFNLKNILMPGTFLVNFVSTFSFFLDLEMMFNGLLLADFLPLVDHYELNCYWALLIVVEFCL